MKRPFGFTPPHIARALEAQADGFPTAETPSVAFAPLTQAEWERIKDHRISCDCSLCQKWWNE